MAGRSKDRVVDFGAGWKLKVMDYGPGDAPWELTHFGKMVERSRSENAKRAESDGKKAFLQHLETKTKFSKSRSYARMRLRQILEARVHLVGAVIELLIMGADRNRIRREAEDGEKAFWKADTNPRKEPLSEHGRRKPAHEAAEQVLDLMIEAGMLEEKGEIKDGSGEEGWNASRAIKWGKDLIGASFFEDPSGDTEAIEEDEEEAA